MTDRRTVLKGMLATTGLALAPLSAALAQQAPTPAEIFNDPDAPVLGNPNGDVTVVEFFDYQCGYCKRDYSMVRDVIADDGNTRLVMKDWPIFGPISVFAAQAVLGAAEMGDYDTALNALMTKSGSLTEDNIRSTLVRAGLNMGDITEAVNANSDKIAGVLDRNYTQAVSLQFRGTPSFVIGRTLYGGVLKRDMLKDAIATARNGD